MGNRPISVHTVAHVASWVETLAEIDPELGDLAEPKASQATDPWNHPSVRVIWRHAARAVDMYVAVDPDVPVRLTIKLGGVGYSTATDLVKDIRQSGDRIRRAIAWLRHGGPNHVDP